MGSLGIVVWKPAFLWMICDMGQTYTLLVPGDAGSLTAVAMDESFLAKLDLSCTQSRNM